VADNGPFGWLVDMLTEAWGEPRVQPPAEPRGARTYRSEVDGLIWIRMQDYSRRAWVWFPNGRNCNLAIDKGATWKIRMGAAPFRSVELSNHDGTWAGLTRETVEPIARWVYGLKEANRA
jgi:hypothetical protein